MPSNREYNRVSWEDGTLVLGRVGAPGCVRVSTPIRLCLPGGEVATAAYSEVREHGVGWTARGSVWASDGTRVEVVDDWSARAGSAIAVRRRATVAEAGTAGGIRIELRAEAHGDGVFENWQLFVPGALYNRNDTDEDGREDYLGTYVQEYRDDRLPSLAVLGFLPGARCAVGISRASVPAFDAAIDEAALLSREVVGDTDVGSLGLAPTGDGLEMRVAYPFSEEHSFCLNTAAEGWAGFLPNEAGRELTVSYELHVFEASSLTDAIWTIVRHQMGVLGTAPRELPFTLVEALEQRLALTERYYAEWPATPDGLVPAGYRVHFSPRTGETLGSLLEYGFSGAQTLLAYTAIESGHRSGRLERVERARKVIDFFVGRCQLPNGFSHGIYDAERDAFVHWFTGILTPFQYADDEADARRYLGAQMTDALLPVARELREIAGNYTRTMCESIYPILLAYRVEASRGHTHEAWLEAGRRFGEFLLSTQHQDGSWHRAYSPDGMPLTSPASWFGSTDIERKSGTIFPIEVLLLLDEITGDNKWLAAAKRAGVFIADTVVSPVQYVGGLNDTTHIKSVKTDSVGVMFVMRSLIKLHERTRDDRFLEAAGDAARILASWIYLWDVPFPVESLLGGARFRSTGWAICDVIAAGSYVDNELLEFMGDLVAVADATGDEDLLRIAEVAELGLQGALSMPGAMLGYAAPGIQCEGLLTSYWLSDPDQTEFSGAVNKRKGDDNDTCNGLINGQAAYGSYELLDRYGTLDFDVLRRKLFSSEGAFSG
jgi:hypothetical protein